MLHSQIPFAHGGAEVLVEGLVCALAERGHEVDTVRVPFRWYPPEQLLRSALAWRLLDLTEVDGRKVDLVICTKFPTWAIKHPRKVLWLVHQHRQAYDLFGTRLSEFGPGHAERTTRDGVMEIDRMGIGECQERFAISKNVADRLKRYSNLDAEALYPPVEARDLWPEAYEPFILSAARLDALKRVHALVEAWPHVHDSLGLVVASDGVLRADLERVAQSLGVAQRIRFVGRVPDAELARLFRTCRAVYYAPVDEDYGYVTVEAHAAGKPVITSQDSGGVLEFVEHEISGQVTELGPVPLAEAINVYADPDVARLHGEEGQRRTQRNTWETVIETLLRGVGT